MKENQQTPEGVVVEQAAEAIESPAKGSRRGFLKGALGLLGLVTVGAARKQETPTEEPIDAAEPDEEDVEVAAETTETEGIEAEGETAGAEEAGSEAAAETGEAPARYTMRWNLGAIERPQNSEQQQLYDEQKPFVTEKMADWLAMRGLHPELDRLYTLFEEANTSGRTSSVPTRFYAMPTYVRDIAIRDPKSWYHPVVFNPFVNAGGVLSFNFSFYYDTIFFSDRRDHTPLDLALAIYNWQAAKDIMDSGGTPEDVMRTWKSPEIVGIYADDMDKVIEIFREVRRSGALSSAEYDEFRGFWPARSSVKTDMRGSRLGWLAFVREFFGFKFSNSELSRI